MNAKENRKTEGKTIGIHLQILLGICLVLIIALASTYFITYNLAKNEVLDVGGELFTRVTKDVVGLMKLEDERVKRGEISLEEAQEEVRTYVLGPKMANGDRDLSKSKMNIHQSDYMYVWALTPNGLCTMHPFGEREGVNVWNLQFKGKYTTRDSWANPKVTGYVFRDLWQNPGELVYNYIAFQEYFEPWNWVVGSGGREEIIYVERLAKLQHLFLMSSFIFLVIGALIAYFLAGRFVNSIRSLRYLMGKAEKGDLNVDAQIKSRDEIGALARSFSNMIGGLRQVVGSLKKEADKLTGSSDLLFLKSQQTATSANHMAVTMNEMSSTVQQVAHSVQRITDSFRASSQLGEDGKEQIIQVKEHIASIAITFEEIKVAISGFVEKTQKIGQITEVITGIVNQTNNLAMNTAAEATSSGESGHGSAVLAEEVRLLAKEAVNAANEIKVLISGVQTSAAVAESTVNVGSRGIEAGTRVIEEARDVFARFINSVQSLSEQVQSIATATVLLNLGIESVAKTTEDQRAAMQEVRNEAEILKSMAIELKSITNRFSL